MRPNNYVAKHSRHKCGAGEHEPKQGKFVKRSKAKKEWKAEVKRFM